MAKHVERHGLDPELALPGREELADQRHEASGVTDPAKRSPVLLIRRPILRRYGKPTVSAPPPVRAVQRKQRKRRRASLDL